MSITPNTIHSTLVIKPGEKLILHCNIGNCQTDIVFTASINKKGKYRLNLSYDEFTSKKEKTEENESNKESHTSSLFLTKKHKPRHDSETQKEHPSDNQRHKHKKGGKPRTDSESSTAKKKEPEKEPEKAAEVTTA